METYIILFGKIQGFCILKLWKNTDLKVFAFIPKTVDFDKS